MQHEKLQREDLYQTAAAAIDGAAEELYQVSHAIWSKPELAAQEYEAHDVLTSFLEGWRFEVQRRYLMDTAFRADYGTGPTTVAVMADYDGAVENMGHACGHNLTAEFACAVGIGVQAVLDAYGLDIGRIVVLGTPGDDGYKPEESGKLWMMRHGTFKDMDLAIASHPSKLTVTRLPFVAMTDVKVTYYGKADHAPGHPWKGQNAMDAAVLAYTNISNSNMNQHIRPGWGVQGITKYHGGRPNMMPEVAELFYWARAPSYQELRDLKERITSCFQTAATATGCKVDIEWELITLNVLQNDAVCSRFEQHLGSLGIQHVQRVPHWASSWSGRVAHVLPTIHPLYYIGTDYENQSPEFTGAAGSRDAQPYLLKTAKAMARAVIDLMCEPELRQQMKKDFEEDMRAEGDEAIKDNIW